MSKNEDPEILDDENEGVGGGEHYDGQAVETIPYDHSQFDLLEDFEVVEDDSDD